VRVRPWQVVAADGRTAAAGDGWGHAFDFYAAFHAAQGALDCVRRRLLVRPVVRLAAVARGDPLPDWEDVGDAAR
jgi:hypothetical protein